jgi:hypothetical protein
MKTKVERWEAEQSCLLVKKPRAQDKFLLVPLLPHKCGVPLGDGTPHLCGSEELRRAPKPEVSCFHS